MEQTEKTEKIAVKLAAGAGIEGNIRLETLSGGGNNRGFRLYNELCSYFLKSYFRHEGDLRDRLGAEFAFSMFAWENGLRMLPRPVACDREYSIGLYQFVEGRKLEPGEVTEDHVRQALQFYIELNRHKQHPYAQKLPTASEACFSINEHLLCVEQRLERLKRIESEDSVDKEAVRFINKKLVKTWQTVCTNLVKQAERLGTDIRQRISREDECLSPSDFGFHNAILEAGGNLHFIDFEYAGWDDPAKMVCDFFCQLAVPVPFVFFPLMEDGVSKQSSVPETLRQRICLLFPVYRIKWCCIILNDFLAVGDKRRIFARHETHRERKERQLKKAQLYFQEFCE